MLHEILPHRFDNAYDLERTPAGHERMLVFLDNKVALIKTENEQYAIPSISDFELGQIKPYYLFSIDGVGYYTVMETPNSVDIKVSYEPFSIYREVENVIGFAITTAWHIYNWKKDNIYCGRCGEKMSDSTTERARVCPKCGNILYPRISPAVAVAILDGDRILLARNATGNFRKFALIAGYVEIGESFEETVRREVKEEVGLELDKIRYYKSSPWGSSGAEMIGFFATLKGSDKVTIQESELAEARWFTRDEIDKNLDEISLSYEMIARFRDGKEVL